MESDKCSNCQNDMNYNEICPYCGYDNKNKIIIDFQYQIEENKMNKNKVTPNNEIERLRKTNRYLKIIVSVILIVNIFFFFFLYNTGNINASNVVRKVDDRVLTADDDFISFLKLLEEKEGFSFPNISTIEYGIVKRDMINGVALYMDFGNIKEDESLMSSLNLHIYNIAEIEKADDIFNKLDKSMENMYGKASIESGIDDYGVPYKRHIWNYNKKRIVLSLNGADDSQYLSVHLSFSGETTY